MEQLALPYYGVQIAAKLLEITTPKISYIAQSQLPNPTITAMYLQDTKEIVFNEEEATELIVILEKRNDLVHMFFKRLDFDKHSENTPSLNTYFDT